MQIRTIRLATGDKVLATSGGNPRLFLLEEAAVKAKEAVEEKGASARVIPSVGSPSYSYYVAVGGIGSSD